MRTRLALFICVLCLIGISTTRAEIPQQLLHQGRLTDAAGSPVANGNYLIKFEIFADSVGGVSLWSSDFQSVAVQGGLYAYSLGSSSNLPLTLFNTPNLWLGITVGADPQLTPRKRLTSGAYAFKSAVADLAIDVVPNSIGTAEIDAAQVQRRVTGTAPAGQYITGINQNGTITTAIDQAGGNGDITAVAAGAGLSGGGEEGAVALAIANGGVTSNQIADGTIVDADISESAGISRDKIFGTAATTLFENTFFGIANFESRVNIGDSTLIANPTGINIGDADLPNSSYLVRLSRNYDVNLQRYGLYSSLENENSGTLYGVYGSVNHSTPGVANNAYGIFGNAKSDGLRYGLFGTATTETANLLTGSSYGVFADAKNGFSAYGVRAEARSATIGYGIYALADLNGTNWAGYFSGNVNVTGTLSKGGGAFRIDHPLDPENKFLQHSFVESPDMMNIYNGNAVTDVDGFANVELPEYFSALNSDFRYQLTVIGQFAQAIIAQKIDGNRFIIQTDKPNVEVSWQVTGTRKDNWANANRIQVELDKPAEQKGKYAHPGAFGLPLDRGIDWETNQQSESFDKLEHR